MKNEKTAKRLRLALSNADKKPQDLADESGVSKSSISQYLNGSHSPSNVSAGKMGKVLHVNPLWLMGFDVDMKKDISKDGAENDVKFLEKFANLNRRDKNIVIELMDIMTSEKDGDI